MIEIEVCERLCDYWIDAQSNMRPMYHAQIKGQPGSWGAGQSSQAAIGNLVGAHPESFDLKVIMLEGKQPR